MKILFIGLGSIGQRHLQNAAGVFKNCDFYAYRKRGGSKVIKNTKILKRTTIQTYYKIKEVFKLKDAINIKPNITFICNPSSLHLDTAIIFAKNNSHIFIEKPLGIDLKKINTLCKILKTKKLISMVGFQMRFHPAILSIKKIINENKYGKILSGKFLNLTYLPNHHTYEDYKLSYASNKSLGGGVLTSLVHEIDLIAYFFGIPKKTLKYSFNDSSIKTVADNNFVGLFHFKKNNFFYNIALELSFSSKLENRVFEINFEKKKLKMNLNTNILTIYSNTSSKKIAKKFKITRNDLFSKELRSFKESILKKKDPNTSVSKNYNTDLLLSKCL